MTTEVECSEFEFEKEYDGVHPYKKGDRVIASAINKRATVCAAYWHMGYAKVDLKFDNDRFHDGSHRWGARRVEPLNAVDALGEIA